MNQSSKPWHILNIDMSHAINPAFALIHLSSSLSLEEWGMASYNSTQLTDVFTYNWLQYMKSIGLEVSHVLVFRRAAGYIHPSAHIDLAFTKDGHPGKSFGFAVNYCIGNDSGEMVWYRASEDIDYSEYEFTHADTPYIAIPLHKLTEISRHRIGNKLTLVRVDIPHNIEVDNINPRVCLSIRLRTDNMGGTTPTWDELTNYLKNYI